ncbi:MAG TPA: ATP-binding protein, partial [Acidobacteriota bacterium]
MRTGKGVSKEAAVVASTGVFDDTEYERQHKYVEELKRKGEASFSLVATETFVEGMRDSGYKSTGTAIDEFVDNAIQAQAQRVDIVYTVENPDANKHEIGDIAVVDDGHGMEPDMIRAALLWGGTHRANDRRGFGRYGFGLPSAAVSVAKYYEVYSRTDGSGWHRVVIDLPEIGAGKYTNDKGIVVAPPAQKADLPDFVKKQLGKRELEHGTVILLSRPDRLSTGFRKPNGFHKNIMQHLGLVYRHFLRSCAIYVNGEKVQPVDPLFQDPAAR